MTTKTWKVIPVTVSTLKTEERSKKKYYRWYRYRVRKIGFRIYSDKNKNVSVQYSKENLIIQI